MPDTRGQRPGRIPALILVAALAALAVAPVTADASACGDAGQAGGREGSGLWSNSIYSMLDAIILLDAIVPRTCK